MTLEEIRRGIIKLLREGGTGVENITGEDVTQTKEMPLLHVQLEPLSVSPAAAGHHRDKEILVDIAYMEKLVTTNRSIYEMLEKLDKIFSPYFQIGDRAFTCPAQMDIEDDIGHYRFTMVFTDMVPFEVPEPAAERLRVEWREKDGIT